MYQWALNDAQQEYRGSARLNSEPQLIGEAAFHSLVLHIPILREDVSNVEDYGVCTCAKSQCDV